MSYDPMWSSNGVNRLSINSYIYIFISKPVYKFYQVTSIEGRIPTLVRPSKGNGIDELHVY